MYLLTTRMVVGPKKSLIKVLNLSRPLVRDSRIKCITNYPFIPLACANKQMDVNWNLKKYDGEGTVKIFSSQMNNLMVILPQTISSLPLCCIEIFLSMLFWCRGRFLLSIVPQKCFRFILIHYVNIVFNLWSFLGIFFYPQLFPHVGAVECLPCEGWHGDIGIVK